MKRFIGMYKLSDLPAGTGDQLIMLSDPYKVDGVVIWKSKRLDMLIGHGKLYVTHSILIAPCKDGVVMILGPGFRGKATVTPVMEATWP